MKEKIEHTVKVEAEGCCCSSSGSWCKFFFSKGDKSEKEIVAPSNSAAQTPAMLAETPRPK